MIIQFILTIFFALINFILSLFTLPGMPAPVLNAFNAVIPFMTLPIAIIKTYVGDAFFIGLLNILIALIVFNSLLRPGMWLYNKIRGSGTQEFNNAQYFTIC